MRRSELKRGTERMKRRHPANARAKGLPKSKPKRKARLFVRNFGSGEYVDATRREPCLFCRKPGDTVRCAHITEARKKGGCGGDVKATGPACFTCDEAWGQGSGPNPTRLAILARLGMTWADLEHRIRQHHEKLGHLYEQGAA